MLRRNQWVNNVYLLTKPVHNHAMSLDLRNWGEQFTVSFSIGTWVFYICCFRNLGNEYCAIWFILKNAVYIRDSQPNKGDYLTPLLSAKHDLVHAWAITPGDLLGKYTRVDFTRPEHVIKRFRRLPRR